MGSTRCSRTRIQADLSFDCKLSKVFWLTTFTLPTWNGDPIVPDIVENGLRYEEKGYPPQEESGHVQLWGMGFHGTISHVRPGEEYAIFDAFHFIVVNGDGLYGQVSVKLGAVFRTVDAMI